MAENETQNIPVLTEGDRAIVKAISEGKRLEEIATLLEKNKSTVGYRLFVLRERYRCRTNASLVSHFTKNKLID